MPITFPLAPPNQQRLLAKLIGANFNVTTDQTFPLLGASKYALTSIVVTNASVSLTLAAGGFYTGAGKTGTIVVAAAQVYSALTGATVVLNPTIAAAGSTLLLTVPLIFALTIGQGSAATADIYVFGQDLS